MPPWPGREERDAITAETVYANSDNQPYHLKLPVRDEPILVLVILLEGGEQERGREERGRKESRREGSRREGASPGGPAPCARLAASPPLRGSP